MLCIAFCHPVPWKRAPEHLVAALLQRLWQMWVCENLFTTPVKCQELGKTTLSVILLCMGKSILVAKGFGIRGGIFKFWFSLLLFLSSFEYFSFNSGF